MIGREHSMDNWTFGWTLIVVGMGGPLAVLGLFAILMGQGSASVQGSQERLSIRRLWHFMFVKG
jgi:hypothetical protein